MCSSDLKTLEVVNSLQLEERGQEQARIEASSPLPEFFRPVASLLGERSWQVLLLLSFIVSACIATWSYTLIIHLFDQGVLAWLLR